MSLKTQKSTSKAALLTALCTLSLLTGCADAEGPKARDVNIPAPMNAETRRNAINERPDPVMYLPLGEDVLLPEAEPGDALPSKVVGPFELRNESLAGALQLVMEGTDIPVAFETSRGLDNTITVTNLKGPINEVVQQICGLADLYCSFQRGVLNVKDTQIFTVSIPPIAASDQVGQLLTNVSGAIAEITGSTPIVDESTRTIVYRATERTSEIARRYFQRLRQNTALIVFETYIWEVSLNAGNSTGIDWEYFSNIGKFNFGLSATGSTSVDLGTPISIGLPTTGPVDLATGDVLEFISEYGAVKTISQPQLTVLAGSEARLRIADTTNYLASVARTTTDGGTTTTSTTTDSVDSGFTLEIGSNWDNATVYGNINILLQEVRAIEEIEAGEDQTVQLPATSERELQTQVRVRPGDSLLIAGLVRERDNLNTSGPGINEPIIPTSRTAITDNVELVFLLKPRVIVFTSASDPARKVVMAEAAPQAPAQADDTIALSAQEVELPAKPLPAVETAKTEPAAPIVQIQNPPPARNFVPAPVVNGPAASPPPAGTAPPSLSMTAPPPLSMTAPPPAAVEKTTEMSAPVPLLRQEDMSDLPSADALIGRSATSQDLGVQ